MNIDDLVLDIDTLTPLEEVPQETEETTEIEETNEETNEDQNESDDLPKTFFEALVQKGYFEEDPEFDGTYESLDKKLEDLPNMVQENLLSGVSPEVKDVLHFIFEAKQNITREELIEFINAGNTDITTADDARTFLAEVYRKQGMKERAIEAQLDDLEEEDNLLAEAKKFAESQNENKIKEKQKLNRELEERQQVFNKSLMEEVKVFPAEKQKQITSTISNVGKIVGEITSDPKKYVKFVEVLSRYKNGEFDFSDIEKKGASSTAQKIKETLNKSQIKSSVSNGASGSHNNKLTQLKLIV